MVNENAENEKVYAQLQGLVKLLIPKKPLQKFLSPYKP